MKKSYQPIIGLEIHIELNTKSKMFCGCLNDSNESRFNVNICPICIGQPGTLPVINEEAIKKVIKTGLALNCRIPEFSKFDRKNYFYPDLPKGYQISQYDEPLCIEGYLGISGFDNNINVKKSQILNSESSSAQIFARLNFAKQNLGGQANSKSQFSKFKKIRIRRVHLEEDTGRLIHEKDYSLIDFNRAGVPLMELVTEPDITSPEEARKFAEEFHLILKYLNVSDVNMEKGEFRVEVNVSLQDKSQVLNPKSEANSKSQTSNSKLGTKVEIKNLNSFRAVEKAIRYEIERQTELLKSGKKIIQETRGWDENKEITISQREKEEAQDYRYFPEPDLPALNLTLLDLGGFIMPELPQQKRDRFKREYQLRDKEIEVFVQNKNLGDYFEKAVSELLNKRKREEKKEIKKDEFFELIRICSNYLITDVQGLLKDGFISEKDFLISQENFAEFITLIYQGKISSKIAKIVLEEMFQTNAKPSRIIEEKGLSQIIDENEIEKIVKNVIFKNPKAVENYKAGKQNALQFLIGQVMAISKGRANPQLVAKTLDKFLKSA